jgi:hypothetical protein
MAGLFAVLFVIGCSTVESAVEEGVDEAGGDGMEEVDDRADEAVDDLGSSSSDDSDESDNSDSAVSADESDDSSSSFGSEDSDDEEEVSRETKNALTMCVSDAETAVTKADDLLADKDDEMFERDIRRYKKEIREVKEDCLEGEQAEKFEGLSDYEKVKKNYKEAMRKLEKYEKRESEEHETVMQEGVGGDDEMVRERWNNRPKRCKSTDVWNKKMGYTDDEEEDDGAANISGSELIEEETGPEPVSLGSPSHGSTARGLTARYMCGKKVEGVDAFYSASDKPGTADDRLGSYALEHDPRTIVGEAANDKELSESRRTIYRAVTSYLCWSRTNWNLEYGYGPYLKCGDVASEIPSAEAVKQAMQEEYPDQEFEMRNAMHMARKAAEAKPKVDEAFAKLEKKYPKLREVFVEPAERAEKQFEEQREKYADIYKKLDPITQRLFEDPKSTPPENCVETLQSARETVAERAGLAMTSPEDVEKLRTGMAVGYQITEALAYCYTNNGELAKARVEADAIDGGTRKLNRAEFIYYARKQALREVEQKYDGDEEKITEVLPNYEYLDQRSPIPLPGSTRRTPSFYSIIWEDLGGRFEVIGGPDSDEEDSDEDEPDSRSRGRATTRNGKQSPVIAREASHAEGSKIVFESNTETVTYQPTNCRQTNRLSHWELRGNRMEAVYETECRPVGDEETKQVTHQHDPVVVPADQAELVEPGMRIEVFNNTRSEGDAAILRAWHGDGSGDPAIYEMMRLE